MPVFQHTLWGYQITYPEDWFHQTVRDADVFATVPKAQEEAFEETQSGQIMIGAEFNCSRQPVEPFWTRHIGMLAGMLGAKQVGSAEWRMGGGIGMEAEIVLAKRENKRLWTGVLARDFVVLKLMVTHARDDRAWFEPLATRIISSLHFLSSVEGVNLSQECLPLPPDYTFMDPLSVLQDIQDPDSWRAYDGLSGVGALQAFYLREAPVHGWAIEEYVPFPSPSELGFARLQMRKGKQMAILGILPGGSESTTSSSPACLAVKYR